MPPERPTPPGAERPRARSIPDLFRSLSADLSVLVRQELTLARAEIRDTMRALANGAARVAAGGAVAAVGALTVLVGIVVLIGQLIDSYWLSAMLVGLVLLVAGGVIAATGGRRLSDVEPMPRRARESMGETLRWARAELASFKDALRGGKAASRALRSGAVGPAVAPPTSSRPRTRPTPPERFPTPAASCQSRPARPASAGGMSGRRRARQPRRSPFPDQRTASPAPGLACQH